MNATHAPQKSLRPTMPRPRRKSSSLGAELRGDNSAAALSTLEPTPTFASPPLTPVTFSRSILLFPRSPLTPYCIAPIQQQVASTALQTAKSPLLPPPLERLLLPTHLGEPSNSHLHHPRPLRHQTQPRKPSPPRHLSLLRALPRRSSTPLSCAARSDLLWQRAPGFCLCGLLHYCAIIHTGIPHAALLAPAGPLLQHPEPGEAKPVYGTSLHGDLFRCLWPIGIVRDVADTRMVFRHGGNV